METVVLTVTHPGNDRYLGDFLESLEHQTDQDFRLLVVDDAMQADRGVRGVLALGKLRWELLTTSGSPAAIRKFALAELCRRPPCRVIFLDSDDKMAANRVVEVKQNLRRNEILFNDLSLFGDGLPEPRSMFPGRWSDGATLQLKDLMDGNCLGLSNTALFSADINERVDQIPDDMIAFDWAFFAGLAFDGRVPRFCATTHSDYRQHAENTTSLTRHDDGRIALAVRVKKQYYSYMSNFCQDALDYYTKFKVLEQRLETDADFSSYYYDAVRRSGGSSLWWASVTA